MGNRNTYFYFAKLNRTDIGAVNIGFLGEIFLREPFFMPPAAYRGAEFGTENELIV